MKVTLVNTTHNAAEMLILAKSTRLSLTPSLLDDIHNMSESEKLQQLDYAAKTVPSSWEFVDYTFLIEGVSRAFTHQLVRTRTGSYAQQAMRVTKVTDGSHGYGYIYDPYLNDKPEVKAMVDEINQQIAQGYNKLLSSGVPTEVARGILPTNISTNIMAKFNLRALAQLINSRLSKRVQPEFRAVVQGMYDEVIKVHPWASKFIFPYGKDYYQDLEDFAQGLDEGKRVDLLKIIDKMRGH